MRAAIGRRIKKLQTEVNKSNHVNKEVLIATIKTIREEFQKRKTGGLTDDERKGLNAVNKVYKNPKLKMKISLIPGESGATVTIVREK